MIVARVFDFPLFSKRGKISGARGISNWLSSSPSSSLANSSSKKAALSFLSVYCAIWKEQQHHNKDKQTNKQTNNKQTNKQQTFWVTLSFTFDELSYDIWALKW